MEADPASHRHGPRHLPAASRKPLYMAKRVSGRHGEVSRRGGGGGAGFITSYFHTDSRVEIITGASQCWLRVPTRAPLNRRRAAAAFRYL